MKQKIRSDAEIASFCMELSLLIHSGIALGDGLHLLREEDPSDWLTLLSERADGGMPVSQAMRECGAFPDDVAGMAEVGEKTGRPEEAFRGLARYYEERERLNVRLRSALLYPSVLLMLMLVVIVVLLAKVLPVFEEVFRSLGGEMTGLAGGLLRLGEALDRGMPLLAALLAAAVLVLTGFTVSGEFRDKLLALWRRIRGDRGLWRRVSTARFAQALAMGLKSGLPVEEALRMAAEYQDDVPAVQVRYRAGLERLRQGSGLAEALRAGDILPPAYCRMLALGVRSGTGDTVMEELACRLQEESEAEIEAAVGRVEPAMVIVASLLVGLILLSVMLPLMNIMSAIG